MSKSKKQIEPYIKLPSHILNLTDITNKEKLLLAHIYSFGKKGCFQSNKTLAAIFMVSPATISRWLTKIKKYLYVKNPKGYYRTLWVKSHPAVAQTVKQGYKSPRNFSPNLIKNDKHLDQKCVTDLIKTAIRLNQNCVTTINNTITETIKGTTAVHSKQPATPPPLPVNGQASALLGPGGSRILVGRDQQSKETIEKFKKGFGRVPASRGPRAPASRGLTHHPIKPLSKQEFEKRKAAQIKALLSSQ